MSPIATRSLRAARVTIGEALRRLGRFWLFWIVLGQWGGFAIGGVTPLPIHVLEAALAVWGIVLLAELAAALPAPSSSRMRWVVVVAAATLLAEIISTFVFDAPGVAKDIGFVGVALAFTGYIVVLGRFCTTLPGAQVVVDVWKRSLQWVGGTVVGTAIAVVFGAFALLTHQTEGVTLWSIGLAVGAAIAMVSSIAALLMTARATTLTRQKFEPGLA